MSRWARFLVAGMWLAGLAGPATAGDATAPHSLEQWRDVVLGAVQASAHDATGLGKAALDDAKDGLDSLHTERRDSLAALIVAWPASSGMALAAKLEALALFGDCPRARTWLLEQPKPTDLDALRGWIAAMLQLDRFDLARDDLTALEAYDLLAEYPCESAWTWMLNRLTLMEGDYLQLGSIAAALDRLDGGDHTASLQLTVVKDLDYRSQHWSTATRLACIASVAKRSPDKILEDLYLYALNDNSAAVRSIAARELSRALELGDSTARPYLLDITELTDDPEVKRLAMNALLERENE